MGVIPTVPGPFLAELDSRAAIRGTRDRLGKPVLAAVRYIGDFPPHSWPLMHACLRLSTLRQHISQPCSLEELSGGRVVGGEFGEVGFVAPTFSQVPWYADHPTDLKIRQETYFINVVLPLVEQTYPAQKSPDGRLLLGFSKSG